MATPYSAQQVYVDQMYSRGYGRPLWNPEPLPKEVEIGDVGIFLPSGSFRVLFNATVHAAEQVYRVPSDFVPLTLKSEFIHTALSDIPAGYVVAGKISTTATGAGFQVDPSGTGFLSAGGEFDLNFSVTHGGALILKEPAFRLDITQTEFVESYIRQHYRSWYSFVRTVLGIQVCHRDLMFVTGVHRTSAWAVAAYSNSSCHGDFLFTGQSLSITEGVFSLSGSWQRFPVHQAGEGPQDTIYPPDASLRPGDYYKLTEDKKDQCVFIRGYKIGSRPPSVLRQIKVAAESRDLLPPPSSDMDSELLFDSPIPFTPDSDTSILQAISEDDVPLNAIDAIIDHLLDQSEAELILIHDRDLQSPYLRSVCGSGYVEVLERLASLHENVQLEISPMGRPLWHAAVERSTIRSEGRPKFALFSVLCFYDYVPEDPAHLSFYQNEILDIIKQEDSGWWAAMRRGGDATGWIPEACVKKLSDEMAERLFAVTEGVRVFEYETKQLKNIVPAFRHEGLYDNLDSFRLEPAPPPFERTTSPSSINKHTRLNRPLPRAGPPSDKERTYPCPRSAREISLSPLTPINTPPSSSSELSFIDTPVLPMPKKADGFLSDSSSSSLSRTSSTTPSLRRKREPVLVNNKDNLAQISRLIDPRQVSGSPSPSNSGSARGRADKVRQLTGDDIAASVHRVQISVPNTLLPEYSDKLVIQADQVRWGTMDDLILRLTHDTLAKDPLKIPTRTLYQNIFLATFRTFTTADILFDNLVARFHMRKPLDIDPVAIDNWQRQIMVPTQRRILTVFTLWLEDHRLLEEEPHIARKLTEFLNSIFVPGLAAYAKFMIQTIERLTFANPKDGNSTNSPRKKKRSKSHKGDLLRLEPSDLAEQLSLYEHKLYAKITPQECLAYPKIKPGFSPKNNLTSFCATHDQLANWVKMSVLNNEELRKRTDTVDFWVKVAEKCRNVNNFASMSSIINALSSSDITRLHLTWTHVNRKSQLDSLLKFNDPSGGWSGYRSLIAGAEGSCVPFIAMYLTDLVHISDQFKDDPERGICFLQRQRWYEIISTLLKFQSRTYNVAEGSTQNFIQGQLRLGMFKDKQWFNSRSHETQDSELANADIRKGLEAAGF